MLLAAKPESAHDARDDLSTGVKGLNKRDYSFLSLYILYIPTLSHLMIKQFKHLKRRNTEVLYSKSRFNALSRIH